MSPTLFGRLSASMQDELRAGTKVRRFDKDAIIQQRGDTTTGFWLIDSGQVAVGQFLADGTFRAIAVLGPGDSYGELALLTGRERVVDAVARSRASLRWIDGGRFEKVLAREPASMRSVLGAMAEELQEVIDLLANLRRGNAHARIARFLARLADENGKVAMSQEELAELAGVTRATVNAALRDFEQRGWIARGYREVSVIELAALAKLD